jgi:hypothetical protein
MIPDLLAGEGEYSGARGYVPYISALKKERSAFEPVNQKMRDAWRASRDEIMGLRETAHDHLWPHLHRDWLPRIQAGDKEFVNDELPRAIALALKLRPFARYLESSKVAPAIMGGIALPTLMLAAHTVATRTGASPEYVDFGVSAATTATAITAVKRYGAQAKQVKNLAIFYQRGSSHIDRVRPVVRD